MLSSSSFLSSLWYGKYVLSHPGAVLQALSQSVEVLEFVKVRPTMESLFIQAVNAAQTEAA